MCSSLFEHLNHTSLILISLSVILFSGFFITRLTKLLHLPKVTGYILAGLLIGPCVLNIIPKSVVDGMGFVSDIALSFIAFGMGSFFQRDSLGKPGPKVVITLFESLAAGLLITLCTRVLFRMDWNFCLLLGAIATATAPASTMMTINQYHAKGEFVTTLLQVVAFDDVVCLLVFSAVTAVVNSQAAGTFRFLDVLLPMAYNIGALGLGALCGIVLSRLLTRPRSRDNRLILAVAMLLGISGICALFDVSPLLSCMVFSITYRNLTNDQLLYSQLDNFTPPILSSFFIISGMNLDLRVLSAVGLVGVAYFIIRILGKYAGAYLGCLCTGAEKKTRHYLGVALIPQAGVAIGLAFLGQRMLPPEIGSLLLTIILASSVLYELIGPACAKIALIHSGSIPPENLRRPAKTKKAPPSNDRIPIVSCPNAAGCAAQIHHPSNDMSLLCTPPDVRKLPCPK